MQRWDIFCRVIDNFGDIGICWRLARQLHHEYGLAVRLWVDDLMTAQRLLPTLNPSLACQHVDEVEICHWRENFPASEVADVVIEAFACELPLAYLTAMIQKKPVWLNLEYLSAESWVSDYHVGTSIHPATGLKKAFFFPGFTAKTGGLAREKGLLAQRKALQADQSAQGRFWKELGVPETCDIKVSLFTYPYAPIRSLLESVSQGNTPVLCLVPEGAILPEIAAFFGRSTISADNHLQQGNLAMQVIPFLSQNDYDRLLALCDLNFVRGEDSWVRALWAGQPFVWLPYRQNENAHLPKLSAFLDLYCHGLRPDSAEVLRNMHLHWCQGAISTADWNHFLQSLPELKRHASSQSDTFAQQPDLASQLICFCRDFFKK